MQIRERPVPPVAAELASAVPTRIARVLAARGVASVAQIDLRLAGLRPPDGLADLALAARRLADAIAAGERILVVGDFDADGATGTAVAVRGLRLLGARDVHFAVPDRQRHGYGLSPGLVDELCALNPQVLVTVDQGTSSIAGVERACAAGIDVLVTDHHLAGPLLPPALAIVNPNLGTGVPGLTALAGVGVVFHLLAALRSELARRGALLQPVQLAGLLDLVALGTVADLVPLDRSNRILVSEGLRRIRAGRASAGLSALIESAGRDHRQLHASDLGFQIGPRLNAAGRLDDMALGIRCLVSDDIDETRELAAQLSELNRERRSLQADMEREAAAIVESLLASRQGALPAALIVADPGWHAGVVGLVASRLAERLHRPTLALAPAAPDGTEWRGSGRSIAGFHLRDALVELDRRQPGLLLRFGGHAMAAGLTVDGSRVAALSLAFESVVDDLLDDAARTRSVWTDGPLLADEFTLDLAQAIESAGPFGQAFAEPLFDNEFIVLERRVLKDKHLKLRLRCSEARGSSVDAIWFSAPRALLDDTPVRLRLLYQLAVERWQGRETLSVQVRHGFAAT
ncbi:MAG TPA: single-stranded-DNA-specific exonuclease RecJ [Xanthomonadales bacterium]|nr:single-stranded-DNA-specific exonuclease RecJ [Xanthomonadales bacterium]